jgi:hypothetical protein
MNDRAPAFKKTLGLWAPFGFCVFLCGLVMFILVKTGKIETAYPAFFCFLPMTFFFVAVVFTQLRKELERMSDRIDQLEQGRK